MQAIDDPLAENRNVSWLNEKGGWTVYVGIVVVARIILALIPFIPSFLAWTLVNLGHAVITFIAFHWDKGVPFANSAQGKYTKLTMWEQLDSGVQWTPTRKFLTLVPIILFMLTTHFTDYNVLILLLNLIALAALLIPKFPFMMRKRLFGINK